VISQQEVQSEEVRGATDGEPEIPRKIETWHIRAGNSVTGESEIRLEVKIKDTVVIRQAGHVNPNEGSIAVAICFEPYG
jgi:hypothetical protein